ncbi:MAG: hypothetical protein PVG65_05170 [Candidatus Thorarchaeota archaeon]|jgi:hypothetical protein
MSIHLFDIDDFWEIFKAVRGETAEGLTEAIEAIARGERTKADNLFSNVIDQIPFNKDDYKRLRNFLRDLYAAHRTISSIGSQISDPRSLTNEHLDELFKSFGFQYSGQLKGTTNDPLESKINFFLDLVNLYKIKGTPQALVEVLQYYGISELDIYAFWLRLDKNGELIFRGDAVAGTSVDPSSVTLDYDLVTGTDPHWLYTRDQIIQLNQTNDINLPSRTPYFGVQPVAALGAETAILVRKIQDQYDSYEASGDLPEANAQISLLGESYSLLELYLSIIYTFYKEYDTGVTGDNFVCYDGTNVNASEIISEYEGIVSGKVTSRQDILDRLAQYRDLFTRVKSRNFLQIKTDAETILSAISPSLKADLDSLSQTTIEVLNSLLSDLADWVRNNIGFGFINVGFILSGLQAVFDNLKPVIDFFKPYRARLIVLESILLRDRLFGSIVVEDELAPIDIFQNVFDFITGDGIPCCENPYTICQDSTANLLYAREVYDCGSYFDIGAATDIRRDLEIKQTEIIDDPLRCSSETDSSALVTSWTRGVGSTSSPEEANDDRYLQGTDGSQTWGGLTDNLIFGGGGLPDVYHTYVRFRNVQLDPGETVDSCRIKFTASYSGGGTNTVRSNLYFVDQDDVTSLPQTEAEFDALPLTSAVAWDNIESWNVTESIHYSPDLSSILQTVINRPGWKKGNDILLIIRDDGSDFAAWRAFLSAEYDNGDHKAILEYNEQLSLDSTAEFDFTLYQSGGFQIFDTDANFDCTHGFDLVQITVEAALASLLQENGAYLLQENGNRILLEQQD